MWGQDYDNQSYFTGISDLSYAMAADDAGGMDNMMGWGTTYHIPFEQISHISMKGINIGPWGKDFQRPSERVFKPDLLERTPLLIDHVIRLYSKGRLDV
jgi:arginine utilization protein RocB